MNLVIAAILALGILPSFTALSSGVPGGPLNALKLGAPLLGIHLWNHRKKIPSRLWVVVAISLLIASVGTLMAGLPCDFPQALLREWSVFVLGFAAALSLLTLPSQLGRRVVLFWAFVIFGSACLDALFPGVIDWLYSNIFDPATRKQDFIETGRRVLTGIYGRQSLAKLLAWMPWLLMAFENLAPSRNRFAKFALWGLAIFSTGIILATSQRGPFVGSLAGWAIFALHHARKRSNPRMARLAVAAILLAVASTVILVPQGLLKTRVKSMLGLSDHSQYEAQADANRDFRLKMSKFSLQVIATHPWGHACITPAEYYAIDITHFSHAHNMILQQFRERGWLWGATHLALWISAFLGAWRLRSELGTALSAGITAVLVSGMFDHPWFVLNHGMVLATFLCLGLRAWIDSSKNPIQSG